jgi:hypothetical protein
VKVSSIVVLTALAAAQSAAAPSSSPPTQPPTQTTPPATAAGAPPPAVPASRVFSSDAGMIFNTIKPDKVADFEMVMGRVKEALGKSQDPLRKQQALSWRVFKGLEAGPGGNIVYVFFFDPAVKTTDYTITQILTEAFPNEAQDLWAKFTACFVTGQTMLNLQQTINMSPTASPVVK